MKRQEFVYPKIRSAEIMARQKLDLYLKPLIINGKAIHPGWPPNIAARKAAAANPTFKNEILKIAKGLSQNGY